MGNTTDGIGFGRHHSERDDNEAENMFSEAWKNLPPYAVHLVFQRGVAAKMRGYGKPWFNYYLDFAHHWTKTAIEIDGPYHDTEI